MQVPGVERGGTGAKKGGKGRERRDAPRHRHAWAQERGKGWERRDTQAQEEGKGVRDMWAREGGVPLPTREGPGGKGPGTPTKGRANWAQAFAATDSASGLACLPDRSPVTPSMGPHRCAEGHAGTGGGKGSAGHGRRRGAVAVK
jgi:hypothetical protein